MTSSGLFSPDGVDKGTAILLDARPDPEGGRLLDIGCGWGPIALTMALKAPDAAVHAVDVNERCLALTAENAARLGLRNVVAQRPDTVDDALEFDTIWSNPPIRIGKEELHALLLRWLPRLAPGGSGPGWSCRRTLVRTRCSAGSADQLARAGLPGASD